MHHPPTHHILNGDALKGQFPDSLPGQRLVLRECLSDGPVAGHSLSALCATRASFIASTYSNYTKRDYFSKTAPELERIAAIPAGSVVCLWFEDDLFCQVNLWFALYLLAPQRHKLYLVRPPVHNQYGFGGFDAQGLVDLFELRHLLSDTAPLSLLWPHYQSGNLAGIQEVAAHLAPTYPFIATAVQTHIARLPGRDFPGHPTVLLQQLMQELGTTDFAPLFRAFTQQAPQYGFGDLQVKRLYENIMGKH